MNQQNEINFDNLDMTKFTENEQEIIKTKCILWNLYDYFS